MEYFTRTEVLLALQDVLKDEIDNEISGKETFEYLVNQDDYLPTTGEATRALIQYGPFKAIHEVKEWEMFRFGAQYTPLDDPIKVANRLEYIIADDTFRKLPNWKSNILNVKAVLQDIQYVLKEQK